MTKYYVVYDSTGAVVTRYDSDINAALVASPPSGLSLLEVADQATMLETCGGGWTVVNGALIAPPAPTSAQLLSQAQSAKIAAINASYAQHQTAGFTSSALGSPHTYPSDTVAQTQLGGRVTEAHIHLLAPAWAPGVTKAAGNWCAAGGWLYQCTTAGTTGTAAPVWPTIQGGTVTDGTAVWTSYRQWGGYFLCTDSSGNQASVAHTVDQMWQVGLDAAANIDALMAHRLNLIGQVNAATTVTAVNAVPNW